MSWQATSWAKHVTEVRGTDKLLLMILADYATERWQAWPAQATLAKLIGRTERTVRRAVRSLANKGIITIAQKANQHGPMVYVLHQEAGFGASELTDRGNLHRTSVVEHRTSVNSRGDTKRSHSSLRSEEEETPSARNLSSSGEKTRAWTAFATDLSSTFGEGILSPVGSSRAYTRTCVLNPDWPPVDVDLNLLRDVARAVKAGMGLRAVLLPPVKDMRQTATWFGKLQAAKGEDFLPWLEWASAQVERKGSLADDKLLLHALTQSGTLKSFSEWEAERAVRA